MPDSRRKQVPEEVKLHPDRDNRLGLTLMVPERDLTVNEGDRFVIVPGEKGVGWTLRIYKDDSGRDPT